MENKPSKLSEYQVVPRILYLSIVRTPTFLEGQFGLDFIEEYEVKNEYVNIILQINGKFKKMIIVPIDSEKEALLNIIELKGTIINIIYIKNKLINILVK